MSYCAICKITLKNLKMKLSVFKIYVCYTTYYTICVCSYVQLIMDHIPITLVILYSFNIFNHIPQLQLLQHDQC